MRESNERGVLVDSYSATQPAYRRSHWMTSSSSDGGGGEREKVKLQRLFDSLLPCCTAKPKAEKKAAAAPKKPAGVKKVKAAPKPKAEKAPKVAKPKAEKKAKAPGQ